MEKKKFIEPETTCFPLGGIRLLDSISVDPSMQGYVEKVHLLTEEKGAVFDIIPYYKEKW